MVRMCELWQWLVFLNQSEASKIVREAGVFRTFLFDFVYPHNSYLFSGIPQIYVAPNKNKF